MHNLGLIIEDTLNKNTFKVSDASVYDDIAITNGILDITPPSLNTPTAALRVSKNFAVVFNTSNLKISPQYGVNYSPLPDGNYNVKYSVAPNQDVYIQYYYFRNVNQVSDFNDVLTTLYQNKCNISSKNFYNLRIESYLIWQDIYAAKCMAQDKHLIFEANELYDEATRSICKFKDKIECLIV